jgi:hypothetical protein
MYWTNSNGFEKPAFTIRFTGTDSGTFEILGDATVSDATFQVEGDTVSLEFTCTFDVPIGDWPVDSYFDGTLTGAEEMSGQWGRQGWECWPESDAGCGYEVEWSRYSSRLVREP